MAKINPNKKRTTSGGYHRMIGDEEMANFFSSVHAACISAGTQVSKRLRLSYEGTYPIFHGKDVNTPDKTLNVIQKNPNGVIIFGGFVKNKKGKKQEIDVIIFDGVKVYLYEIKDGDALDTKKSTAEIDGIEYAMEYFKTKSLENEGGLVSLHMNNGKHSIKDERADKYIISGNMFCKKFDFNFDKYKKYQEDEHVENQKVVLDEMKKILSNRKHLEKN